MNIELISGKRKYAVREYTMNWFTERLSGSSPERCLRTHALQVIHKMEVWNHKLSRDFSFFGSFTTVFLVVMPKCDSRTLLQTKVGCVFRAKTSYPHNHWLKLVSISNWLAFIYEKKEPPFNHWITYIIHRPCIQSYTSYHQKLVYATHLFHGQAFVMIKCVIHWCFLAFMRCLWPKANSLHAQYNSHSGIFQFLRRLSSHQLSMMLKC